MAGGNGPDAAGAGNIESSSSQRDFEAVAPLRRPGFLGSPRTHRLLALLTIFILPSIFVVCQVVWSDTHFLLPSLKGSWVLHPFQEIEEPRRRPASRDVVFEKRFDLKAVPTECRLRLRAFKTSVTLEVNGANLLTSQPSEGSWKSTLVFDISKLLKPGQNRVEIQIHNEDAVPALLVTEPSFLRTPDGWSASLFPDDRQKRGVVPPLRTGPPEPLDKLVGADPPPLQRWMSRLRLGWLVPLWLFLAGVSVVLSGLRLGRKARPPATLSARAWRLGGLAPALIAGLGLCLHLSNALHFPYQRSPFDLPQHVEYIQKVEETWQVPDPRDGFEMYQPPLYYFVSALLYRLAGEGDQAWSGVQCFGALMGWGLSVLAWLYARRLFPGRRGLHSVAFLFAAFLPMSLYTSPLIGNEVFSAVVIAAALLALMGLLDRPDVGWKRAAAAGAVTGLAMLSKYTGIFTLAAGAAFLGQRALAGRRRGEWRNVVVYLGSALLLCGWLYARNLLTFGDPFIGNWDEESDFQYVQNPGFRSAGFYFRFGQVFFHHPERAPWLSFFDGQYASMWADVYRVFLPPGDGPSHLAVGVVLLLAALPTASLVGGVLRTVSCVWRNPIGNVNLLLLSVTVWTILAVISFTIEVPFASTVKAHFALSLLPALGVYLVRGRELLADTSPLLRVLHDIALLIITALNVWLYTFRA